MHALGNRLFSVMICPLTVEYIVCHCGGFPLLLVRLFEHCYPLLAIESEMTRFGYDTSGSQVVEAFKDVVKGKICKRKASHAQTSELIRTQSSLLVPVMEV